MKKIIIAIFVAEFFLLWPIYMQETGFIFPNDDVDYFAHASSLVFGQFPSYKKEYLMTSPLGPQCSIGSGIIAAPFVFIFSFLDCLNNSDIMEQRTEQNVPTSWSEFGFIFSSVFYFILACVLLYRATSLIISPVYAVWAIILMVICQGMPLYAFRRPVFSHIAEFFMQSLFLYLFIRNEVTAGQYIKRWWSFMLLGTGAGLLFLIRLNNVGFAVFWPLLFLGRYPFQKKNKNILNQLIYMAVPFAMMVLVFKTWPEIYNHYVMYPDAFSFVRVHASWFEILKRIGHVFFGLDWGLFFTAPFCLLGFWGLNFLDVPWKKRYLIAMIPLLVNFYIIVFFGSQGGWYGYRYFIASAFPLLIIPLAFLFEWLDKQIGSFWKIATILIALFPAMSMWCFEGYAVLKLHVIPQYFGRLDWSNDFYQINVWYTVIYLHKFLHIIYFGGIGYISYLLYVVFNGVNYVFPFFQFKLLVEVLLLYMLPFVIGWFFRDKMSAAILPVKKYKNNVKNRKSSRQNGLVPK